VSARKLPRVVSVPPGHVLKHTVLKHTVFQLRQADEQGEFYHPRGRAALAIALNQALIERGTRAPWMWSAERCQRFWATLELGDDPNAPNGYAAKRTEIVDLLHDLWRPDVTQADTVLEVGCNAGANLARLRELGYSSLSGVEINPVAIAELRRAFPELAQAAIVHRGRVEDVLPTLDTGGIDVVFAMAVLHHIHPSSRWVFSEMVRIARRHICVMEPEQVVSHYVFCRDYQRVFEGLGCRQVRAVEIGRASFPEVGEDYHGYTARLFRVPGS
jgi:SAM-dependent methyltransferase